MAHPWLVGAAVAYLSFGIMVCIIGIGDYFEQQYHEDERWWHLPRALAFCLFISQWVMAWVIIKDWIIGDGGRWVRRKLRRVK